MLNQILEVLKLSLWEMGSLVGVLMLVGFVLGLSERQSNYYMISALGRKGVLVTAWLGTPVHELGHAVMCVIFRHKITDMKLLITNGNNGTLGYVSHTYNRASLYQTIGNFFIGIAPIFSGITAILLSMYFLLPNSFAIFESYFKTEMHTAALDTAFISTLLTYSIKLLQSIFSSGNLLKLGFWIFIFIAIAVSSHMALSRADIKGAAHGLVALFVCLVILNIIGACASMDTFLVITRYNAYVIAASIIALAFSLLTLIVSFALNQLINRS